MAHTVSDTEWTLRQLLDKLLAPLIVLGIVGGIAGFTKFEGALAETKTEVRELKNQRHNVQRTVNELTERQASMLSSQQKVELNVREVQTDQRHMKEDIAEIKAQNREILRILREEGRVGVGG